MGSHIRLTALPGGSWLQSFSCCCSWYQGHGLGSKHNNHHEDRVWDFSCRRGKVTSDCSWTGWINGYDEDMNHLCPDGGIVIGVQSKHNNHREDRIWKLKCCKPTGSLSSCSWSGEINRYDRDMDWTVDEEGSERVIVGFHSIHIYTTTIMKNVVIPVCLLVHRPLLGALGLLHPVLAHQARMLLSCWSIRGDGDDVREV